MEPVTANGSAFARRHWPMVVVGGGPAAALQLDRRTAEPGPALADVLVIGERWASSDWRGANT